jgi:hypothetical protein
MERWRNEYWGMFARYRQPIPQGAQDYSFEYLVNNLRRQEDKTFLHLLGGFFLCDHKGNAEFSSIEKAMDDRYRQPTRDVSTAIQRLMQIINKEFKSLFPNSSHFIPKPMKEAVAVCVSCDRSYSVLSTVCGTSWNVVMLPDSPDITNDTVEVTELFGRYWKAPIPPVGCRKCLDMSKDKVRK